jgi:MoxR-like ATPase
MERVLNKLEKLREELRSSFLERDQVIDGALCCLLSGSHLLLIGPPGTAKSLLAHELCTRITGANYFQWLLTKFTTPEEIFGAVSLKGLEQDEYRRVTIGKLPEAHIAFLDEVFKSSSSILNTLLTIMNERVFYNGPGIVSVPLITLIGASNEVPTEEEELEALYDRFLLRYVVDYIREDFRFLKMIQSEPAQPTPTKLTLDELRRLQAMSAQVAISPQILKLIVQIRRELSKKGILVSDRRYKQSLSVLRARAFIDGREGVTEEDLNMYENILWRLPEEKIEIKGTIYHILYGYRDRSHELLLQAKEMEAYANRSWENEEMFVRANIEAQTKLKMILANLNALIDECRERGKSTDELENVRMKIENIQKEILDKILSSGEALS